MFWFDTKVVKYFCFLTAFDYFCARKNPHSDFHVSKTRGGHSFGHPALGGVARSVGTAAARRVRAPAVDQRPGRGLAPRLVGHLRMGRAHLRAVECDDHLVDLERHARGSRCGDTRLDDAQHAGLHALPHRLEEGAEGPGLHHARRRVDHHRILVHHGGILLAVAHPRKRILARRPGRTVVRIYGRLRRLALGAAQQHPPLRDAPPPDPAAHHRPRGRHPPASHALRGHPLQLAAAR